LTVAAAILWYHAVRFSKNPAPKLAVNWFPTSKKVRFCKAVVKNITDYGAFVDLGGVDGLLHVTDIAWKRINHPSEALQVGQTVDVQVIRFNSETQRISLGMKQLQSDPWSDAAEKFVIRCQA
jgi:ribosomal protein S1